MHPEQRLALLIAFTVALACLPAPQTAFPQAGPRPRRIAVLKFQNQRPNTDTDWIGANAAETVTTKLTGLPGLTLVERSHIGKVIQERNFQQLDLTDPDSAVKVGKSLGAERIVVGSYACHGSAVMFNVRVIDVQTAAILNASTVTGSMDKIFDTVFQLAEAVIQSFDKKVAVVDARPVVRQAPAAERLVLNDKQKRLLRERGTTNLQAYQAFGRGLASRSPDEAIRWFTAAIQHDPNYAWSYHNRGSKYEDKGEYARALPDLNRAVELDPTSAVIYNTRGLVYHGLRQHDRAMADFNKAIQLDPNYAYAYNNQGLVYCDARDHNRAVAAFTRAIAADPSFAGAYSNRGEVYRMQDKYAQAEADLNKAIQLKPDYASAYTNRCGLYVTTKRYRQAIADGLKAIQLKPNQGVSYNNLTVAYLLSGDYNNAWVVVREARRRGLGQHINAKVLDALKQVSGRAQ